MYNDIANEMGENVFMIVSEKNKKNMMIKWMKMDIQ